MLRFLIITLLSAASLTPARGPGVDLFSFSLSPWITTSSRTGPETKDSYFNTAAASVYFHGYGLKGAVTLPVTWTVERFTGFTRYAVYPADLKFYLARSLWNVQPRMGLAFPLNYPTDNASAWIGSGNTKLILGLGFQLGEYYQGRLQIGGEVQGQYYLNGIENGARFGRGSISGYGSIKAAWRLSKTLKTGVELFPFASRFTEADWAPDSSWSSLGALPLIFLQKQIGHRMEIGIKAGYGRDISAGKHSSVYHGSLSFNKYLY